MFTRLPKMLSESSRTGAVVPKNEAICCACLRHASTVRVANIAPTVNARGPLFVHPNGIVKRTTFHVLSMYANLLQDEGLDASVWSRSMDASGVDVPVVDAIATVGSTSGRVS